MDTRYWSDDQPDKAGQRAEDRFGQAASYFEAAHRRRNVYKDDQDEIEPCETKPDADGLRRVGAVDQLADEFFSGTLKEFGKRVVEIVADAHGLGLPLRMAEFAVEVVKWRRVAEGEGTVEISAPIPLGPGVDLELSANLTNDQGGPPLTVCCAPSDGSSVGVAQIGPFVVSPSTEHERADLHSGHAGEAGITVSGQLLQEHGTKLVCVLCDPETGRVVWLRHDEDGDSTLPIWRIRIEVDPVTGRLIKPAVRRTG